MSASACSLLIYLVGDGDEFGAQACSSIPGAALRYATLHKNSQTFHQIQKQKRLSRFKTGLNPS
jgi:hypothetical protein